MTEKQSSSSWKQLDEGSASENLELAKKDDDVTVDPEGQGEAEETETRKYKRKNGRTRTRFNRWLRNLQAEKDKHPDTDQTICDVSIEDLKVSFVYEKATSIAPSKPQWQVLSKQQDGKEAWHNYPSSVNDLLECTRTEGKDKVILWTPKCSQLVGTGQPSYSIDTYRMLQGSKVPGITANCQPIRRILIEAPE